MGNRRPGRGFRPLLLQGTVGSGERLVAGTAEGRADARAVATVQARVGLTAVGHDGDNCSRLAIVSRKSWRTLTGGGRCQAVSIHACTAVLTSRAGERKRGRVLIHSSWKRS